MFADLIKDFAFKSLLCGDMLNFNVMCRKYPLNSTLKSISCSIAGDITLSIAIISVYMNKPIVFVHACDFVHNLLNFIRTAKQFVVLNPLMQVIFCGIIAFNPVEWTFRVVVKYWLIHLLLLDLFEP